MFGIMAALTAKLKLPNVQTPQPRRTIPPLIASKWRAAIGNTGTTLLQYSTPFAPVILGAGFADQTEVGAYFLFSQMVAAPFSLFRRALNNYFNAAFSHPVLAKASLKNNRKLIFLSISILTIGSAALVIVVALHGAKLIHMVIGEKWLGSAHFLLPMIVYFTFDAVLQPITTLLPHWGASKALFALELARFVSVYILGSFLIILLEWNFFQYSIFFFASMLAVYFAEAFYSLWILRNVKHE